jgi:hypothetical protein
LGLQSDFLRSANEFYVRFHRQILTAQIENRSEIGFLSGFLTGFLCRKSSSRSERRRCANQKRKSVRGQKRGKGGSDPTLVGFQPPKSSWDRSRPFFKPLARVHAPEQTFCNASHGTNLKSQGENTVTLQKVPSKRLRTIKSQSRLLHDFNCARKTPIRAVRFSFLWLISM